MFEHNPESHVPNVIIAGVEKAGTTSLFSYLSQHPQVCTSRLKETAHFSPARRGEELPPLSAYDKYFDHCSGEPIKVEASPAYWYGGLPVAKAIKDTLPKARIVIAMREPVARLWSAFTFLKSTGRLAEELTFEQYIADCEGTFQRQKGHIEEHTPLSIGLYDRYADPWIHTFGNDLRFLFAEQLFADPVPVLLSLCTWLGIDGAFAGQIDYHVRNETVHPRSYLLASAVFTLKRRVKHRLWRHPAIRSTAKRVYSNVNLSDQRDTMNPETRTYLEDFYRDSKRMMRQKLLGLGYRNLPEWLLSPS